MRKKMSKTLLAFNEVNLTIMGLYDTVYDMYVDLQTIYNSAIEQLDTSTLSFPDKADDACRSQVRQVLDGFLSSNTGFFSRDYEKLHINAYGMKGFSMFEIKHGARALKVTIRYITFHSFLEEFFMVVVRTIAQRRNRQYPGNEIDAVFKEVNQRIDSLATQYRKRIPATPENRIVSEDNHLFVYSQFSLLSCNQKKHTIVSDIFCAEKLDGSGFYNLPIHRCATCGRKFVGKYTLDFYQKEFGKICVTARKDVNPDSPGVFEVLKQESELHSRGYNVVEGHMPETERRNLLIYLLQSGEMTYFDICRDIKNAIHMQQNLPYRALAVAKWKSDLEFLSAFQERYGDAK